MCVRLRHSQSGRSAKLYRVGARFSVWYRKSWSFRRRSRSSDIVDELEAMVEPGLGANCPHRLWRIRIFIERIFHTTMPSAQLEDWHSRANSPGSKKRYQWIHSGNYRRSRIADRGIEARQSLIRWQLSYSTPFTFFFFFGRACGASNIRTV
jgi:hypothetical protein